jgi:phospholipase C
MAMPSIKHIVVLMLENRGFDHMVGYMQSATYDINGIDPNNPPTNPMCPADPTLVAATPDAPDELPFDAGHSVPDTNLQLFFNVQGPPLPAGRQSNQGFVYSYSQQQGVTAATAPLIMKCFAPGEVRVLTTLAKSFALCTRWHASVPGPTWPNRFFVHCATSKGFIDNSQFHNLDMQTIFENLSAEGNSWKIYSHDFPQTQVLEGLQGEEFDENWRSIGDFKSDAANNSLPDYAFIEPKYTSFLGEANDQHPPHSVQAGEHLIADVYNAVRESPAWNDTLLIILYDEHGGTFDHVLPPETVPPDGHTDQFGFDRLGLRVPAILISPYISAVRIIDTLFDHSSIPAMVKRNFALPQFLTARDAQANTFEHVFDLTTPRTDAPRNVAPRDGAASTATDPWGDQQATTDDHRANLATGNIAAAPVSDLQHSLIEVARATSAMPADKTADLDHARRITTEHDAAVYLRQAADRIRQNQQSRPKP